MNDTNGQLKEKHERLKDQNGGYMPPPFCFVCGKEMAEQPTLREMVEKKIRVKRVVLSRAGESKKYPLGLERHSSCSPGTKKWARYQDPKDKEVQKFCRWFGVEPGRQYSDEECKDDSIQDRAA